MPIITAPFLHTNADIVLLNTKEEDLLNSIQLAKRVFEKKDFWEDQVNTLFYKSP